MSCAVKFELMKKKEAANFNLITGFKLNKLKELSNQCDHVLTKLRRRLQESQRANTVPITLWGRPVEDLTVENTMVPMLENNPDFS